MAWTSRAENEAFCEGPLGRVATEERVARIIIRQDPDEHYNPFQRSELLPPKKRPISHDCGEQDGLSVDRCSTLTNVELVERSARRAAAANQRRVLKGKEPNQFPYGAAVAEVANLRGISRRGPAKEQVVFIYDDAFDPNFEHAVVRISDAVPEEEVAIVLDDLKRAFDAIISAD